MLEVLESHYLADNSENIAGSNLVGSVDHNGNSAVARSGYGRLHLHNVHNEELIALRYASAVSRGDAENRTGNRSLNFLTAGGSRGGRRSGLDAGLGLEVDGLAVDNSLAVALDLNAISLTADRDGNSTALSGRRLLVFGEAAAHGSLGGILKEENTLLLARSGDKDVLVSDGKTRVLEHLLGNGAALLGIGVVHLENSLRRGGGIRLGKLVGSHELSRLLDDLRIGSDGSLTEVAENHLGVTGSKLLELAEHDVLNGLLGVELRNGRYGRTEAAETYAIVHFSDHIVVLIHHAVVAEHLGIGRQSAARHRAPDDLRIDVHRFRREEVLLHRVLEAVLGLLDLVDVEVETEIGIAVEAVPHRDDVGLASAAGHRRHRKVDAVGAALERGEIAGDAVTGRLVAVELDVDVVAEKLTGELHGVVDGRGRRGAGGVLEADAIERNAGVHDEFEAVTVELGRMGALVVDSGRKTHHRDGDFMLEPRVVDALTRPLEVVDVVQGVEVADRAHTVLLEHIGVELDHVGALRLETDDVHAARKRLEIGFGSGLAEGVHDVERVFLAVEVAALETGAAAGFEPADAGIISLLHAGKEIFGEDARADDALETVAERCEHELYIFLGHFFIPF